MLILCIASVQLSAVVTRQLYLVTRATSRQVSDCNYSDRSLLAARLRHVCIVHGPSGVGNGGYAAPIAEPPPPVSIRT